MADAQGSWEDDGIGAVSWIDDPSSNHRSLGSLESSHISASIETSSYDTHGSVPSTAVGPEGTPVNGSVESGRAKRWAQNGIRRLPDGTRHPRNIYNDPDTDYEELPPSGNDDSGSSNASPLSA